MGRPLKPLAAQRLLLAALLSAVAISAALLFGLRHGVDRGRARLDEVRGDAPAVAQLQGATPEAAPETPASSAPSAPSPERTAGAPTVPEPVLVSEEFDPAALTGRVLSSGAPVAGVEVRLYPSELARRGRATPLAQTTSDEAGRFRIAGLEPHRRFTVCLQHPEHVPSEESLFPGHEEELELDPSVTVRGLVRSASGAPLAGVEVALECWHAAPGGFRALVGATSDAEGRWTLPWAEPGMERFLVLRPGHLPETREFQVERGDRGEYEIVLGTEELVTLELYLLEDGTPLADTDVWSDEVRVRTDARGVLLLPLSRSAQAEGSLRVALALENGPLTQGRIELGAERPPGTHLRLPLARGGTITGRVVDGDGQAVEGAEVRLAGGGRLPAGLGFPPGFWLNPPRGGARTASDGSFTLAGLAPREGLVSVRADHPEHPSGRSEPFEFRHLGETHSVEVRLEEGATIAGEVRVDGEPASVRLYWNGERGSGWTRSNDRGAYRLRGLPSGEIGLRPRLEDEDEDLPRAEDQTVFLEDGARLALDFELDGGRLWIRGRVLDTLGEPVADADVTALPNEEESHEGEWMGEEARTESGPDGTFALAVPERAGLRLDLHAQSGPARVTLSGVRPGTEGLELVLPALAPVALRVVDALDHDPVLGFQLYWRFADEGRFERLAQGGRRFSPGPDGTFVAELPLGRLDLAVAARTLGYVPARREGILVSGTPAAAVEFELERGVELTLEVRVPPEAAGLLQQLQRGRIAIASEEQWSARERDGDLYHQEVRNAQALRLGGEGAVRIGGLAPGRYRFVNVPKGATFRPKTFELPPVASHRQSVTLEPEPEKKPGAQQD